MNGQRPAWADMLDYLSLRIAQRIQSIFGFVIDNRMETYQYGVSVTVPATAAAYVRGAANTGTIEITAESDFVATAFTGVEEILTADATPMNRIGQVICGILFGAATSGTVSQVQQPSVGPGLWDYLLTDGSTDRQMSNQAIHAYAGIGIGSLPYQLPKPRLFKRNSNIRIAFTLRHGTIGSGTTETVNIQFVAHGYKVYDRSALNLTERV